MKPLAAPTLIAALVVVLLSNALVLLGVAWNRHGRPDSVLNLGERELRVAANYYLPNNENSGLNLELNWSVAEPLFFADYAAPYGFVGSSRWFPPAWLDRAKLAQLGVDVSLPASATDAHEHYERMLERAVLLVLEMDGPAYAATAAHLRERAAREAEKAAAQGDAAAQTPAGHRRDFAHELALQSRLFVVDAGLNQDALRRKYPDRGHYAIVRGSVRPRLVKVQGSELLYGTVTALRCENINVPLQFRPGVPEPRQPFTSRLAQPARFTVAFGTRLEPWILSAGAP